MRFWTTLLPYPSQSLFPVRLSSVYNAGPEIPWPCQFCSYIWSTSAQVCHHLKIVKHDIVNIVVRNFEFRTISTLSWRDVYCYTACSHLRKWTFNNVVVERYLFLRFSVKCCFTGRWLERMNNWKVRLMENVAELRKHLCEEEHK